MQIYIFLQINVSVYGYIFRYGYYWLMPISDLQKEKLIALGKKLKAIRQQRNLTLKGLAFSIDKDPQSIHGLEMGKINPSDIYLLEICNGLNIDITELLKNDL